MLGRIREALGFGSDERAVGDDGAATEGEASADTASDADDEDGSIWDFIPGWQYGGRHAESGGIARGEQERALRDIERKAEIIEDESDHSDPAVDREQR